MIPKPYAKPPLLKPWLVNYIKDDGASNQTHAVKIIECVSGPDEEGNLVRYVTDGEIYLKAIITGKAVEQLEKEVDSGIPSWDRALLLVRKHSLKFEPDVSKSKSGFALVIEEFKIWDFLCGFDLKKDILPGYSNPEIQHKILMNWTKWKNVENAENTNNESVTGSQMLSLLAEMGQMTQTQEDSDLNITNKQPNQDPQQNLSTSSDLNTDKGSLSILHKSVEKFQSKVFDVFDFIINREEETKLEDIAEWKKNYMPTPSLDSYELSAEQKPFSGPTLISDEEGKTKLLNKENAILPSAESGASNVHNGLIKKGDNSSAVLSSAVNSAESGLSHEENFGFDSPQVESLQFSHSPSSESIDSPRSQKENNVIEEVSSSQQGQRTRNVIVPEVKENKDTNISNVENNIEIMSSELEFGGSVDSLTNKEKEEKSTAVEKEKCNDDEDIVTSTQPFTYINSQPTDDYTSTQPFTYRSSSPPKDNYTSNVTVGPEHRTENISRKRLSSVLTDPKPSKYAKISFKSTSSGSDTSDNLSGNTSNSKSTREEIYQSTQRTASKRNKAVPDFTLSPIKDLVTSSLNQNSRSVVEETVENREIVSDLVEHQRLQKLASISSKSSICNSDDIVQPTVFSPSSKPLKSPTENQIKSVPVSLPQSQDVILVNEVKTESIVYPSSPSRFSTVKTPIKQNKSTHNVSNEMDELGESDIMVVIEVCDSEDVQLDKNENSLVNDSRTETCESNQDSFKNMEDVSQNLNSELSSSIIKSSDISDKVNESRHLVRSLAPNTKTWQELLLGTNQSTKLQQEILNYKLSKSVLKEIHTLFNSS